MAQTCFAYRRFFAGKATSKANRQASMALAPKLP
jgi:hypothetical protein